MPHFRSKEDILTIISEAGFKIASMEISAPGKEEWWFTARVSIQEMVA
jgi:hypothetical protein